MISREEVLKLAELARLKLNEGEAESLGKDISDILAYVGQVSSAAGGEAVPPPVRNVMREDVLRPAHHPLLGKEEALRAAFPTREGDFNSVRKIIQKDE